jgi:NAD+ synthase (glutamine-hydrolysing)
MKSSEKYNLADSYLRVATACPEVAVADVDTNVARIEECYQEAVEKNVALVVFPELSITGYTIGDLVQNRRLLNMAAKGLTELAGTTAEQPTTMVVGLPVAIEGAVYNCAAVVAEGEVKGLVPKQNMPTYGEFYEKRWYQAWHGPNIAVEMLTANGETKQVPFGRDLLFDIAGVKTGVEICEDLWVADPPSRNLAQHGALIIANPSASPELVGKSTYRKELVAQQSARLILAAYAYAGSDSSESTMDVVMGGHQLIAENGKIRTEREPFATDDSRLLIADVDIDHALHDRRRDTNWVNKIGMQVIKCATSRSQIDPRPYLVTDPFWPEGELPAGREKRLQSIIDIAATGLAQRLKSVGNERVVLGLSGGLDSTLALLIASRAAAIINKKPREVINTLTMPGMASTHKTQNNAQRLANKLGIPNEVIDIEDIAKLELEKLSHDGTTQDVTYENVQARARTELLFNFGNKNHCLVLGTGDLSESAIGWCTYNGDHMSHYNVNTTIPKTLVRHLVRFMSERTEFSDVKEILQEIIDTPISPELTQATDGEISQKTEDIVGPYILHEFFLTYLVRWGDEPAKIRLLAEKAFKDLYEPEEINHWLGVFFDRFTKNQFKRSVMPDGPKVGSVALSPRGDWRMPSDLPNTRLWE